MTKKEQCKQIMSRLFGQATAEKVENMDEETCVEQCKNNVRAFLGEETANKEFANIK